MRPQVGVEPDILPMAFTGQGVAMLSSVLKSERAIAVNIATMRAFLKMRELLITKKNFPKNWKKQKHILQITTNSSESSSMQ